MVASTALFPTPASLKPEATAFDLKTRLDWGEPALTIIDIRTRSAFNQSHIMGAVPLLPEELIARASAMLENERDIYIYGDSAEQAAAAAAQLREVGFLNVAELKGGLPAWKAAGGAIEGYTAAL